MRKRLKITLSRPTARAAGALIVIAASIMVWWRLTDADFIDAWVPNIVTGLLSIAVTITFVEWLVRTSDRQRARPRRERAEGVLVRQVRYLVEEMHRTTEWTHPDEPAVPFVESIVEEVQRFVAGLGTETEDPIVTNGRDDLIRVVDGDLEDIRRLRARDSDVLDHAVVLAIDEYLQGLELVHIAYEQSLIKGTEERRKEVRRVAYEILGERVAVFVRAAGPYVDGLASFPKPQVADMNVTQTEHPLR